MTRYKCPKCGDKLVSPEAMVGREDKCPTCGHMCVVPGNVRRTPLIAGACALFLLVVVVAGVYWNIRSKTATVPPVSSGGVASGESAAKAPASHPMFEYLEPPARRMIGAGYNAHVLIKPMRRTQLEALGQALISKMRRLNASNLKAWVYYDRADYAINQSALWMNATWPDYEVKLHGAVPATTTPQGLFEAYVAWQPEWTSRPGKDAAWCEYDPATATVVYHDRWIAAMDERVHMPAIVIGMTNRHLPPGITHPCWASLPGLKRVMVHVYQKNTRESVATVSFGRRAFEQSLRLSKGMHDRRRPFDNIGYDAQKRRRAKVMSDDEYHALTGGAARQIYNLYENLWVELSTCLDIKLHKKLPKAPPEFYRQYYFGGD